MGASGWSYAVPYEQDVETTLATLRGDVFRAGDYYPAQVSAEYAAAVGMDFPFVAPDSIDELIEAQEEEGTHSILDMDGGVSDEPELYTVSPLTDEQLAAAFGTTEPAAADVAGWIEGGAWAGLRERWSGLYVVCFDDGAPEAVHFAGVSGD